MSSDVLRYRWLGAGGSAALSLAGCWAGVLPVYQPQALWFDAQPTKTFAAATIGYAGLIVLAVSWWRLGRLIRSGSAGGARQMMVTLWYWVTPLALGAPLFSRDVYSYAAQGAMAARGWDVYTAGPSLLGGPFAAGVNPLWRDTPAPYGPVFVWLAEHVARVTGDHVLTAVMGMRVVALIGFALIVWSVRRLAVASGADEAGALWLAALNPLVLVHLVSGAHNDAIMLGLMLSGLVLARRGRLARAAVLITLGMLVKAPVGLALIFLIPGWSGSRTGWVRRSAVVAAASVTTVIVTTALLGYGYGWLSALSTPVASGRELSISSDIGVVLGALSGHLGLAASHTVVSAVRAAGLLAALGGVLFWFWRTPRLGPEYALGMALLTVVILSPAVQPWYFLWGLLPIAAGVAGQAVQTKLAAASVGLLYFAFPCGQNPDVAYTLCCYLGAALALMMLHHMDPAAGFSRRTGWLSGLTYRQADHLWPSLLDEPPRRRRMARRTAGLRL
ncbi:DUF2029 domain-containing protein [Streptomyces sp. SID4948]|nr:DUF2029 domain-containing protein [Streptomyces sp. SID4948]